MHFQLHNRIDFTINKFILATTMNSSTPTNFMQLNLLHICFLKFNSMFIMLQALSVLPPDSTIFLKSIDMNRKIVENSIIYLFMCTHISFYVHHISTCHICFRFSEHFRICMCFFLKKFHCIDLLNMANVCM